VGALQSREHIERVAILENIVDESNVRSPRAERFLGALTTRSLLDRIPLRLEKTSNAESNRRLVLYNQDSIAHQKELSSLAVTCTPGSERERRHLRPRGCLLRSRPRAPRRSSELSRGPTLFHHGGV